MWQYGNFTGHWQHLWQVEETVTCRVSYEYEYHSWLLVLYAKKTRPGPQLALQGAHGITYYRYCTYTA